MAKNKKLAAAEAKQLAYDLYMTTDKSQKEIARIVQYSEQTIHNWKNEGNWDDLKLAYKTTRDENIRQLQMMFKKVVEQNQEALDKGELTASDVDKQHKIAATIDTLSQDVPLRVYVQCFVDFVEYIRHDVDQQTLQQFMALQYDFLTQKASHG